MKKAVIVLFTVSETINMSLITYNIALTKNKEMTNMWKTELILTVTIGCLFMAYMFACRRKKSNFLKRKRRKAG